MKINKYFFQKNESIIITVTAREKFCGIFTKFCQFKVVLKMFGYLARVSFSNF